jgi:hypothetical protein
MTPTPRKPTEEYAFLTIRVESHDVNLTAGINSHLFGVTAHYINRDAAVFESTTRLDIHGVCTDPTERAGQQCHITLYEESPSTSALRVKDIHAKDKHDAPKYRTNRGKHTPMYDIPDGLAVIERRRSDGAWTAQVPVAPKLVTHMLILLGHTRQTYLFIHERRLGRRRWIRSISLQTTDPATE